MEVYRKDKAAKETFYDSLLTFTAKLLDRLETSVALCNENGDNIPNLKTKIEVTIIGLLTHICSHISKAKAPEKVRTGVLSYCWNLIYKCGGVDEATLLKHFQRSRYMILKHDIRHAFDKKYDSKVSSNSTSVSQRYHESASCFFDKNLPADVRIGMLYYAREGCLYDPDGSTCTSNTNIKLESLVPCDDINDETIASCVRGIRRDDAHAKKSWVSEDIDLYYNESVWWSCNGVAVLLSHIFCKTFLIEGHACEEVFEDDCKVFQASFGVRMLEARLPMVYNTRWLLECTEMLMLRILRLANEAATMGPKIMTIVQRLRDTVGLDMSVANRNGGMTHHIPDVNRSNVTADKVVGKRFVSSVLCQHTREATIAKAIRIRHQLMFGKVPSSSSSSSSSSIAGAAASTGSSDKNCIDSEASRDILAIGVLAAESADSLALMQCAVNALVSCSDERWRKAGFNAYKSFFKSYEPRSRLCLLKRLKSQCPFPQFAGMFLQYY
jgi:hypothetical protein